MPAPFLEESLCVLARTPGSLDALLRGLPDSWTRFQENPSSWSPYQVIGHLIQGEVHDWIPRLEIILNHGESRAFTPFDREAMSREPQDRPLSELLSRFAEARRGSLDRLRELDLQDEQLELRGTHPAFGAVTMRQLLATWTAHDLGHTLQIARTMARRYKQEVGPWAQYLSVMG